MTLAVLMRAAEIPLGSTVTKRTGAKPYTLVDRIRLFIGDSGSREIKAEGGALLITAGNGDFNAIGPDVELLWHVEREVLIDFLTGEEDQ